MRDRILFVGLTLLVAVGLVLVIALSGQAQPVGPVQIMLRNYQFDPLQGEPALPAGLQRTAPAGPDSPWLVQFAGPVREEWKAAVRSTGGRLYSYIPDYAFLVRMDGSTAERVRGLSFVRWVGPFHPAYRLAAELLGLSGEVELYITAYPDADLAATTAAIQSLGGQVGDMSSNEFGSYVRATLPAAALTAVAQRDEIVWIERYVEPELNNDVARGIMNVPSVWQSLGLFGSGQIVAVADTGLDTGNEATLNADFKPQFVKAYALGRTGDWSDDNAHGTHVAGSVLGNGTHSGSNPPNHDYGSSFAGIAPEASLVFQSLLDSGGGLGGIPNDLNDLFTPPYNDGARIHTNSWGASVAGAYHAMSAQVDQFTWNHRDMLVLFSAGNSGTDADSNGVVDLDSMGAPGTAKNTLTVGAMENVRSSGGYSNYTWGEAWPSDYPADPINSDLTGDNSAGMAAFSSRGPCDDGRIKPDIAAPGTNIVSARSQDPNAGTGWGVYDQYYIYEGGTSMSCPLTAGAATLVREWLVEQRGVADPSGALVKVLLMNGAKDVAPGQYGTGATQEIPNLWPNNVTGWGRVDLANTVMPTAPRQVWFDDFTTGLTTGQTKVYTLSVGVPLAGVVPAPQAYTAPAPLPVRQLAVTSAVGQQGGNGGQAGFAHQTTRPAAVTQLLGNPGFEDGVWSPWTTFGDPELTVLDSYEGYWSAFMGAGNYQDDEILQTVTIPADATDVTIDFWYGTLTYETLPGYDFFCYGIWPTSGPPAYVEHCLDFAVVGNLPWTNEIYTLSPAELSQVAGQAVIYGYYVTTDFSSESTAWVDANNLYVTTPGGPTPTPAPPTNTPLPGPTNTPLPGPTNTPQPGGTQLRIGLAWTDYPGDPVAARALVNDLDLEVIAPNGTHYYGNAGVYSSGQCLRAGQWDQCNNAEVVYVGDAAAGNWQVVVHGQNIPQGPQPFAITVWGDYVRPGTQPPTPTATPVPPTNTPGGPTNTPVPPTSTPGGPTVTPHPTIVPGPNAVYLPVITKNSAGR